MTASSTVARRDRTIDVAKGIAIIAIVLGHVLRGLAAAHLLKPTTAFHTVDTWLYSWHLSVFALLAGLFVARSVQRSGPRPYLRRRLTLFAYLYLVWTLLQGMVKIVVPSGTNIPASWLQLIRIWHPDGQLWFLPWIAIMTLLAVIIAPWRTPHRAKVTLIVASAVSLGLWGHEGSMVGTQGWSLLAPFLVGVILGADRFQALLRPVNRLGGATVAVVLLVGSAATIALVPVTPPTSGGATRTVLSVALGVLLCGACTAAIVVLARGLALLPSLGAFLALCGQRSLEIFLAHIIVTAGTRTLLLAMGVEVLWLHIVAATVTGVMAPLVLWRLGVLIRFPWLFELPRLRPAAAGLVASVEK